MEIEDVMRETKGGEIRRSPDKPAVRRETRFLKIFVVALFFLLAARVFYLQAVRGVYYSDMARENRIRGVIVKAPRGLIFDRNGKKLVQNVPSFDLIAIPADLPKNAGERKTEAEALAGVFGMNESNISAIVESQDFNSLNPVLVRENVGKEEALVFLEKKESFKGFMLDKTAVRQYERGECFAPVIGYSGKITREELKKYPDYLMTDSVGKTGLEKKYEKYLHGEHGRQEVEVDSAGNIKKNYGLRSPVNGSDLVLGIDYDLQVKLFEALERNAEESETRKAAAVAIDPRNGEILALVSLPGYDNNIFSTDLSSEEYRKVISDDDKPMFNRAVSGEYPPGSTFKPLVAAAALEEGTITANTTVNCTGGIHIGSWNFPDWKTHGLTDVRKAIAESCDVFFYSVGGGWGDIAGLGIEKISEYAKLFGFGKKTGIDIPGEKEGLMPDKNWKLESVGERWYIGDDYHSAIGQGFIGVTPVQLASYTAAIANEGKIITPHIVRKVKSIDGEEKEIIVEENIIKNIDKNNFHVVREGMKETISSAGGTARSLNSLPVEVAGKTGTSQFGVEEKTHSWFMSFAPYENPEIAMVVLVEGGGEEYSKAVPVTREVYEWYFGDR